MHVEQVIKRLEVEWDSDGFLDNVRRGRFDAEKGKEFLELIRSISLEEYDCVPKRFVSLLWYLPIFLTWQRERVDELGNDVDAYDRFTTEVVNSLETSLGVP